MISTISSYSSPYVNNPSSAIAVPGRQPVSEESVDLKASTFKSLEQAADSARNENQRSPDDRPNDLGERARLQDGLATAGDKSQKNADRQGDEQDQQEISELAARDREVRAHEQAHAAVGGASAGSPVYEFVRGPDGVNYAVGGEVKVSTAPVTGDLEATIIKAQQLRRAATAPADPSDQDRRIAAEATQMEVEARAELQQEKLQAREAEAAAKAERLQAREADAERKAAALEEKQALREQQEQSRSRRTELLLDASRRNIDINRQLLDIGVNSSSASLGTFLDSIA